MITFFPEPYPDELLYSLFARYHVWSGHAKYADTAQDLFLDRYVHGDPEFMIGLNEEARKLLTATMPFEELVCKTTMFNYYARFLEPADRMSAMQILDENRTGIHRALRIGQIINKSQQFLRYCPECVRHDREQYMEAYWHRKHQMRGINVCPEHGCKLICSSVKLNFIKSPNLYPAEQMVIASDESDYARGTDIQRELARYVSEVFGAPLDMQKQCFPGKVIKNRLYGTKYASPRGGLIKCEVLLKDLQKYYEDNSGLILSRQQLYDTLRGIRTHMDEICKIAVFLRIPVEDIVNATVTDDNGPEAFDAKVMDMRRQGIPYKQIAQELHASLNIVKPIGTGRYRSYSQATSQAPKQRKKIDWNAMDERYYPAVKAEVMHRVNPWQRRPERICPGTICRAVGIRREHIMRMKRCLDYVEKHTETWEQYWERKIIWAAAELGKSGMNVNMTNLMKYTGIKKSNILKIITHTGYMKNIIDICRLTGVAG